MKDAFGRNIHYLRVSITDRCNLNCRYCKPGDMPFIPHDEILRYEEILRICRLAGTLGIDTIKVTGGEPLVRKGAIHLLRELKRLPGIQNVTLTTNGILLADCAGKLAGIGIDGVNISLDTIDPALYAKISGNDHFAMAWKGLQAALKATLPVKINSVLMRDIPVEEYLKLAKLAETHPIAVRFIEWMPIGTAADAMHLGSDVLLQALSGAYPDLKPGKQTRGFGPARYYESDAFEGAIGIIGAESHNFCGACNRIRLTSTGQLKLCLFDESGIDLKPLLRGGISDEALITVIETAIREKPEQRTHIKSTGNCMSRIGG